MFSFTNSKIVKKVGPLPLLHLGGTLQLIGAIILLIDAFAVNVGTMWILVGLFIVVSGVGLTGPNATALALSEQQNRAGTASALMGSLQFALGLFAGVLLSIFTGSVLEDMATTMMIYALLGLTCVYVIRHRAKRCTA